MASSVATPLERHLGAIADVNEMTSTQHGRQYAHPLQFDLDRDIDGAARDVQAAINAARCRPAVRPDAQPALPQGQPGRRADPDARLTSDTLTQGQLYDAADAVLSADAVARSPASARSLSAGSSLPAVRVEINPPPLSKYGIGLRGRARRHRRANANRPRARSRTASGATRSTPTTRRAPPPSTDR